MVQLKPIRPDKETEQLLQKVILDELYNLIFKPFLIEAKKEKIINSKNALLNAILQGKITYDGNYFKGSLNASISKELRKLGASFDKRTKGFKLENGLIPTDVRSYLAHSDNVAKTSFSRAMAALSSIDTTYLLKKAVDKISKVYFNSLNKLDQTITANVVDVISVKPELSEKEKQSIAEDYSLNLQYYIKDFTDKEIVELRSLVEQNFNSGNRSKVLKDIIEERYGVSSRKAEFLAKQETNLLFAKYSNARYLDLGIKKYKWSTSHDSRVRPDHAKLNGKIFSFDDPPVVDDTTGRRANPSEDYGCRCVAIPIIQ